MNDNTTGYSAKMPAKLKELWLKALRDGEFEQTTSTLCDGKGYCCLGVLEMVADGMCELDPDEDGRHLAFPSNDFLTKHTIVQDGLFSQLASDNDSGTSFDEIANIIERDVVGG